jgi:hypothetical protein
MAASSNPAIVVRCSEMFSDLTCKMSRSSVVLEPRVSGTFPEETLSKSVHWAVGVTSKAQSKSHAKCPPKCWRQSVVCASEQLQHEGLLLGQTWLLWLLNTLRVWKHWLTYHQLILKRIAEAAATISQQPGIFERTRQSLLRRCQRWLFIEVGLRTSEYLVSIGNKLQLFQNNYAVLLHFQHQSYPLWRSVALQGSMSNIIAWQ